MVETLANTISEWSAGVARNGLPSQQQAILRLRILDTLGLILAALGTPQSRSTIAYIQRHGGMSKSTLIGEALQKPAEWSAFYHATLAHSFDFDDTFIQSLIHPGSVVVPVALAVGEETAASGTEICVAIAIGYEVAARLGEIAGRKLHARGFHATGILGPIAAAVTAARLYNLSSTETARAIGLAGSTSSGLLEFLGDGSWSKWFQCGWAAHGGIVAAQLSANGFSGPVSVLEGVHGLYRAFLNGDNTGFGSVTENLGKDWRGSKARFKHYPCAHVIQPFLDAALGFRANHGPAEFRIDAVRCLIASWCIPLVCEPRGQRLRPRSSLEAIASLPYLVAVALVTGSVSLDAVLAPERQPSAVFDLAERVCHIKDKRAGVNFEGQLEIDTADGKTHVIPAVLAPDDGNLVRAKFRKNAARSMESDRIEALENAAFAEPLHPAQIFTILSNFRYVQQ